MVVSQSSEGAPLLVNSAITSHLREVGYPEKSIISMLKCGQETPLMIAKQCGCGTQIIALSHKCNLRVCSDCAKIRKRRLHLILKRMKTIMKQENTNLS